MFRARRVAAAFPARKACSRQDTLPLAREERDQDADDRSTKVMTTPPIASSTVR
jgi:hypothetical protein